MGFKALHPAKLQCINTFFVLVTHQSHWEISSFDNLGEKSRGLHFGVRTKKHTEEDRTVNKSKGSENKI